MLKYTQWILLLIDLGKSITQMLIKVKFFV